MDDQLSYSHRIECQWNGFVGDFLISKSQTIGLSCKMDLIRSM